MSRTLLPTALAVAALTGCHLPRSAPAAPPLNVLFIAVDDLRPQIHAYGDPLVQTPNIDRLVERGALFSRAYCQQAVCNPSRSSLLTGRRPDTLHLYDLEARFRDTLPDVVTLPQYFKSHGYFTQSIGKVFHGHIEDPVSWSVPAWSPTILPSETDPATEKKAHRPSWQAIDAADDAFPDGQSAAAAVAALRAMRPGPFFLAVGFSRPHLPLIMPKQDLDRYPPERIALAPNPSPPAGVPAIALPRWLGELGRFDDIPASGKISDDKAREIIRAYDAAVTHIDRQIGRVVDALDELGLRQRTLVVVWGDHGWHLGEHGLWAKDTNFEVAARVPLIISAPGLRPRRLDELVEFVDIYPTLAELAGLPPPDGVEGVSFAPLVRSGSRPWKRAAFTQTRHDRFLGRSMRTDRYRYTEWADGDQPPEGVELYDHVTDPDENVNLARQPEQAALLKQLAAELHAGWRAAVPPR